MVRPTKTSELIQANWKGLPIVGDRKKKKEKRKKEKKCVVISLEKNKLCD